ncbi:hypothetical protein [Blautia obeum]|uniref:hypothetical protein n=2 Tax=Blautia obeum TaxID=40520 RepID=UPI0015708AD2|nr:hypothetical protein [Blautia obeum]NSJ35822.1 hypothetical protein [Blautia obeum]
MLTDGHMPHIGNGTARGKHPMITHQKNIRYITGIRNGVLIGFRYFAFRGPVKLTLWVRGNGKGKFLISDGTKKHRTEIKIAAKQEWSSYAVKLTINKTSPLYMQYKGKGQLEFLNLELEEIK